MRRDSWRPLSRGTKQLLCHVTSSGIVQERPHKPIHAERECQRSLLKLLGGHAGGTAQPMPIHETSVSAAAVSVGRDFLEFVQRGLEKRPVPPQIDRWIDGSIAKWKASSPPRS